MAGWYAQARAAGTIYAVESRQRRYVRFFYTDPATRRPVWCSHEELRLRTDIGWHRPCQAFYLKSPKRNPHRTAPAPYILAAIADDAGDPGAPPQLVYVT